VRRAQAVRRHARNDRLDILAKSADLSAWNKLVHSLENPQHTVTIALVGKYVDLTESYKSLSEALTHAGIHTRSRVQIHYVDSEAIERDGVYYQPSAYAEPYPITRHLIEEGRAHLLEGNSFDTLCPVRILQGMRDPDVPWSHALSLVDLLTGNDVELSLIKDGDHRLSRPEDIARLEAVVAELVEKVRNIHTR